MAQPPRTLRVLAGASLAGSGVLAGSAVLAGVLAEHIVRPRRSPRFDERVVAVSGETVTFAPSEEALRPGRYGLQWAGGHAVVGAPVESGGGGAVRALERVDLGTLRPGKARFGHVAIGDPRSAHGLDFEEAEVESDVGVLRCWEVPAAAAPAPPALGGVWALVVHGYGGSRASTLDLVPILHGLGLHVLAVAYRNDPDAPRSPDRRYHLGASEWRDLDAAMAYATARGARALVLVGWSMGGAIVMQAYARSAFSRYVAGIVLDCPVLDWAAVLESQGRHRRVPQPVVALASRLVEARIGARFADLDWTDPRRAATLAVPVLCFHGEEDRVVPAATSRSFAALAPSGLVELEVTPGAGHVGSWYLEPEAYAGRIGDFSERLAVPRHAR
ncbi:MAG TPA: alpha/beta fold hydrolase [Acidimicrobiales bacterium]|nr:alpha/beta fold hydrolase [Acidimicrobiales bacterium]